MRLLLAAAIFLAAAPVRAAQAYAVSVEQVARASDAVLRGTVGRAEIWRSDDGRRIFTTYEVRTREVLRGHAPRVARVVVPGGALDGIRQRVDAAPALAAGEELIVFLQREEGDRFRVSALAQGKFSVAGGRARPDLSSLSFVRTTVPAGERRVEEMPVAELERRVRSAR